MAIFGLIAVGFLGIGYFLYYSLKALAWVISTFYNTYSASTKEKTERQKQKYRDKVNEEFGKTSRRKSTRTRSHYKKTYSSHSYHSTKSRVASQSHRSTKSRVAKALHLLEISRKASIKEIKRAYRKKAKKYHPDTNGGHTTRKFIELTNAYKLLLTLKKQGAI